MKISYQHPAMNGTIGLDLALEGDSVRSADIEVGFRHHGFEKLLESVTWEEGVGIAGRIRPDHSRVCQASANALGYAVACEASLGIVPPRRAQVLRVILAELMRLAQHLDTLRLQALAAGAESMASELAERLRVVDDALADLAGDGGEEPLFKIGGLRRDLPESALEALTGILREFPVLLGRFAEETLNQRLLALRLRGVGRVSRDAAIGRGLTGPVLRASGVAYDVRRTRPYCGYERYDFAVPTQASGDAWARFVQRLEECRESLRIVALARDDLREGPVDLGAAPEDGDRPAGDATLDRAAPSTAEEEVYSATEAATGELGYFLVAVEPSRPYRVRIRAPSFYHAAFLPDLLTGEKVADVPGIVASFGLVAGEIDR